MSKDDKISIKIDEIVWKQINLHRFVWRRWHRIKTWWIIICLDGSASFLVRSLVLVLIRSFGRSLASLSFSPNLRDSPFCSRFPLLFCLSSFLVSFLRSAHFYPISFVQSTIFHESEPNSLRMKYDLESRYTLNRTVILNCL